MVDKRSWFIVGYMFMFLSVYLISLLYALVPTALKMETPKGWNSYIASANATMSTSTTMQWMPMISLAIGAAVFVCVLTGSFAMGEGLKR